MIWTNAAWLVGLLLSEPNQMADVRQELDSHRVKLMPAVRLRRIICKKLANIHAVSQLCCSNRSIISVTPQWSAPWRGHPPPPSTDHTVTPQSFKGTPYRYTTLRRLADCRTPLPPPVVLRSTRPPVPPPPTHTVPRCPRIPLSIRPLGGSSRHIDVRRVIARRCRPRPWSTWNTIARLCLACRGAWYEASSGKTVVLFKFLKIIVKSQSQTSRFWCYTMLEIIAIAMSIIVTTLRRRNPDNEAVATTVEDTERAMTGSYHCWWVWRSVSGEQLSTWCSPNELHTDALSPACCSCTHECACHPDSQVPTSVIQTISGLWHMFVLCQERRRQPSFNDHFQDISGTGMSPF